MFRVSPPAIAMSLYGHPSCRLVENFSYRSCQTLTCHCLYLLIYFICFILSLVTSNFAADFFVPTFPEEMIKITGDFYFGLK